MAQRTRRVPTVPFDATPVVTHARRSVRVVREAHGLHLRDLAEKVGCSKSRLSRLEDVEADTPARGPSHVHIGFLAHIAHALDRPLEVFLPLPEPSDYHDIVLLLRSLSPQSLQAVRAVVTALQPTRGRPTLVSPTTSSLQCCPECILA